MLHFLNARTLIRLAASAVVAISMAVGMALIIPGGMSAQAGFKAVISPGSVEQLEGTYSVDGRNPNGSPYEGRVYITAKNGVAFFRWEISGQTFHGQGSMAGAVLTIDWGESQPVIYQVNADGTLDGTWSGGKASERLVRIK
ncbi:hypothetical protein [uncultured Roseibium sp.]|uniref:LIC10280 family protein n=1 Tax=uncultured Roseibium sp. TaxID=1936171 RepID=UPI00259214A5|nr:hypothetical protein [uncultured Roseibium sp.]